MKAKDLIESPGFNAVGPSGTMYPRGYHIPNQMYPGRRGFEKPVSDFNVDPLTATPTTVHVRRIDQRIEGGMSKHEAIVHYAQEIAADPKELTQLYDDYMARVSF